MDWMKLIPKQPTKVYNPLLKKENVTITTYNIVSATIKARNAVSVPCAANIISG